MKKIFLYPLILSALIISSCKNENAKNELSIENQEVALSEVDHTEMAADVSDKKLAGPVNMKGMKGSSNKSKENNNENESNINIAEQTKKIIRSGSISIESKDLNKTKQKLDEFLQKVGGYYEQENTSAGSTYTNYNLIARVPANHFDNFIKNIEIGDDKITDKNIQAQDVSIQYYDVESRLKSKRSYLEKYNQMVKSAKNVTELLEIQEQIRQLQEDIESSESILRNLSGQIDFSSIQIHIFYSDSNGKAYATSYFSKIVDSLKSGWDAISEFFLYIISLWPFLIVLFAAFAAWKKYKSKNKTT